VARTKAIIFDLDDTLYDCTGALVDAARKRAAKSMVQAGLACTEEQAYHLQKDLADRHGPRYPVFDRIAEQYGLGPEVVELAIKAYNRDEVEDIIPFPDVVSTLRNLRSQGYMLFLVTSGVHQRQQRKIDLLGLASYFDETIINDAEIGSGLEECFTDLLTRHALNPHECISVGDRIHAEIRIANYLRLTTVQMLHGRYKSLQPKGEFEEPDFRIRRISELHDVLVAANKRKHHKQVKMVAIGGGTGLPMLLAGLKSFSRNLTAIVTVTDSGRSSGMLRRNLGVLPPGDARNCLVALSSSQKTGQRLHDLFQYRFTDGGLAGMSFGNLFLAALEKITGSFEESLRAASDILAVEGKVIPSTLADTHLCAVLKDGTIVRQEYNVRGKDKSPIEHVYLEPEDAIATEEAIAEIEGADMIIVGPGSLYTSVVTNLLVRGITRAIRRSNARVIYACNIVTQPGQTDGYTAADHVRTILKYLGPGTLDCVIVNNNAPPSKVLERYKASGASLLVSDDELRNLGPEIIEADLVENAEDRRALWEKEDFLRHDPEKLAHLIVQLR